MRYQVSQAFKVKTSQGERELLPGQVISLAGDKAIRLLNESKITPIEKAAYKVWSDILQGYLWVVDTNQDMHTLRTKGITAAIYSKDEIKKLRGMDKDSLKEIHKVKEVFPASTIEQITKKENKST